MKSEYILNIKCLKKRFTKGTQQANDNDKNYDVIDGLNLIVPNGKITALIGGNGAGKTTLFNIISGLIPADEGEVLFQGNGEQVDLTKQQAFRIANLGIGRMFQDNHIFRDMSVIDNMLVASKTEIDEKPFVSFFQNKLSKRLEEKRTEKVKSIFYNLFGENNPFWEKRNMKAGSLSYGQQRLLGLARLLMNDYKLLLLDEPTAGVNPAFIEKIKEIIDVFVKKGKMSVFLIEHNMQVVLDMADFCSFMSAGKVSAFGTPDDVIGNKTVRQTYLGM